ncbi:MAG: glucose-1-phosphate adenylyltransferase [Acidobacteriota bacterium]
MSKKVISVILAGGQGSRLYPLTKFRSKPAVPIAGRFRLIDCTVSNCIHSGLKKIFIMTQFSSVSLHRHIFLTYRFDHFNKDFVTVLSAQQTLKNRNWYQGTADAVRQNLFFLQNLGDLVLILSGDHLYRMDYRKFIEFHRAKNADISISVCGVPPVQVSQFGVMKVDSEGRITRFEEKPKQPSVIEDMAVPEEVFNQFGIKAAGRSHLASMGVYLFKWEVLKELLESTSVEDFGREVIPYAIERARVYGYLFDGYWEDIGTIRNFFDAHMSLTQPIPEFNFYDEERPIFTHSRFLPGSKIISSEISNSIINEGSIINGSRIINSIVGVRSRIEDGCFLEKAVIMGADFFETEDDVSRNSSKDIPPIGVGPGTEIRNAIIDKNARIGRGVRLINAKGIMENEVENYVIRDGILVIPKNSILPNGTVI